MLRASGSGTDQQPLELEESSDSITVFLNLNDIPTAAEKER
jgi:hypothetical protein